MIEIIEKNRCCGCAACANICPKNCIEMTADEEGFQYPKVDLARCINCEKCINTCPLIGNYDLKKVEPKFYIVQAKDDEIRAESTSGGAFTPLANVVLSKGGIIFGDAFRDHKSFYVEHCSASEKSELAKFRGSKYVQSDMNTCMKRCRELLNEGKYVLFSGTPCQIAGLKKFLNKDYSNLYTVDVVCRAVPSPKVFTKYVELQKKKYVNGIENIRFRDKTYGYNYSTMAVYPRDGKACHRGIESDLYLRAFFSGVCNRPSCSVCKFRDLHLSDLTIWDCFNVKDINPSMDDNRGTSRIKVNTQKGQNLLQLSWDQFNGREFKPNKGKKERAYSEKIDIDRKQFFNDIEEMESDAFFKKYFPETPKVKILERGRLFCYKVGIYNLAKNAWNKLKNR